MQAMHVNVGTTCIYPKHKHNGRLKTTAIMLESKKDHNHQLRILCINESFHFHGHKAYDMVWYIVWLEEGGQCRLLFNLIFITVGKGRVHAWQWGALRLEGGPSCCKRQ